MQNMDTSHVVFFFGSGVSRPFGMPMVDDITEYVFKKSLDREGDGRYVFSNESNSSNSSSSGIIDRTRAFLEVIRDYAKSALQESEEIDQKITYEDLLYLCHQIRDDQRGVPSDIAIRPLSEKIRAEIGSSLLESQFERMNDLAFTAEEATWLISGVIREALSRPIEDEYNIMKSFEPLLQAIDELDHVTIVTLNHDLIIEKLLENDSIDISYDDGFGIQNGDLRLYDPGRLLVRNRKVHLIKLHGSINWYRIVMVNRGRRIIYNGDNPLEISDAEGNSYSSDSPEPALLSRTGKEREYHSDIFGHMTDAFLAALRQTSTVIESGFGWKDYGIRRRLLGYLEQHPERKLVLLHRPDFLTDFLEPYDYPSSFWPHSFNPDQIIREPGKYLCETSWDEIRKCINRS